MNPDQHIWRVWASKLEQVGARKITATLLEAAGPLALLGAQFPYLVQPLFRRAIPEDRTNALARLLEEPAQTEAFVAFLREEPLREPH